MRNPFRGFNAILYKEFIVILRDRASLFFMFVPAVFQIIAYGYALDMDVKHIPMVVMNEDGTRESVALVDRLVNTQSFRVVGRAASVEEMTDAIRRGQAYVGLQIPPGYRRDLMAGRTAHVQALIDGSNSTIALKALNTAMGTTFRESLVSLVGSSGRALPIELRPQILYNPSMLSPNFYIPAIIAIALQIAMLFATTLSIVRERESGTIENLTVSPLSPWGLLFGKLTPYMVIGLFMASALFLIMRYMFNIPIHGSITALYVSSVLYIFTMLSLGLLASTWARNHMQAMQFTLALVLPSLFFSGLIFPREPMPRIFYALGNLLPSTYFVELMRAIILRGAGLADFAGHLAALAIMGVALFALCLRRFKGRIA
ncbi:MAG: ABC transporter permease [Candidatus Sumerlaeaceae bacterium]|nr:ABC transporter permease [Candidatus Sumerlaeaceae bacterium]